MSIRNFYLFIFSRQVLRIIGFILLNIGFVTYSETAENSNQHNSTILVQLETAITNEDIKLLYDVQQRINRIWNGDKEHKEWQDLRDKQIETLLTTLENIEKHVDWQFDDKTPIVETLDPPINYNVMIYSSGFGVTQIKDPERKAQIRADLQRVRKALNRREFQRHLNQTYPLWLNSFISSLVNDYPNKIDFHTKGLKKLIIKSIESEIFQQCLTQLTNLYYQQGSLLTKNLIRKHQGNCKLMMDSKKYLSH